MEIDPSPASKQDFATIIEELRKVSGVDFSQYKPNTIQRRALRRIAILKLYSAPAEKPEEKYALPVGRGFAMRMSPAMAAGVTDRLWDVSNLVALCENTSGERKEQREMSQYKAIRVGEKMPSQYRKMAKAVCPNCGATFSIVHHHALADAALATDQSDALKSILSEEHFDDKFQDHPPSYDLDD